MNKKLQSDKGKEIYRMRQHRSESAYGNDQLKSEIRPSIMASNSGYETA